MSSFHCDFTSNMEGQMPGAGPLYGTNADEAAFFTVRPKRGAGHHRNQSSQSSCWSQSSADYNDSIFSLRFPDSWQQAMPQYTDHNPKTGHQSTSTMSSFGSNAHPSRGNSVFSDLHFRNSVASVGTALTGVSDVPEEYHRTQTERQLNANSILDSQHTPAVAAPTPDSELESNASFRFQDGNEGFPTCMTRTKRSKRSAKPPRYWCTSCEEGFGAKCDWIRHEETYQERPAMYPCDMCEKTYFLDKDFVHHHQNSHKCRVCAQRRHVENARRGRRCRTAWGCGFCDRFDTDWNQRCAHVASHFESGKTISEWHHSRVIWSLLQQPRIHQAWVQLLEQKQVAIPSFSWNRHTTGRAEGFSDAACQPQLQDLLEFYTNEMDPTPIVQLAFDKNKGRPRSPDLEGTTDTTYYNITPKARQNRYRSSRSSQFSGHASNDRVLSEQISVHSAQSSFHGKELPVAPLDLGPPVPPKDDPVRQPWPCYDDTDMSNWHRLADTTIEDRNFADTFMLDANQPYLENLDLHLEMPWDTL
ncbi:hypothetical protein EJ04DRAFT_496941 [Polyplosphaeria fusca]|uniref:C2H2-type domain-containing protein n=1 Tax=Polyplosphaeria fusca TaxID=682080 RepID=A0A9P4QU02_9PLEO|nr:hypothetical protein EJ04DRAFT_496941 [Polyplosphaeria fusca]